MSKKERILVTGGTGYIGRRLVDKLIGENYTINLLVRNPSKVQASVADKVTIFQGDTFSPETLHPALQDVSTAYYLIHSMGHTRDYAELDRQSATNFRNACIAAGVKRIIYLGGLGAKSSASEHLMSRIETGEILSAHPEKIQTIWIRAGVIIGSGSASFEIIRNLCQKLPIMTTPKWVRTLTQPIGVEDVLKYLSLSITLAYEKNLVVDIGSAPMSFQEMMQQAASVMGLKRFLFPVPVLSPQLSSYWLILFTPIPYKLASALVEGLKSETILQNDNAKLHFPEISPQSFKESVKQATTELEERQILSRWCDSSSDIKCDISDFDDPANAILRDTRIVSFPPGQTTEQVFNNICCVGGDNGWFRYNLLWRLRGFIDKVVGGYGLNRGRRCKTDLRIGDALDFWKVADIKRNKRLLLLAQMKIPGKAWLEFDIQNNQLVQTAHFIPNGLLGRLYWYSLTPFHHFVFKNLSSSLIAMKKHE